MTDKAITQKKSSRPSGAMVCALILTGVFLIVNGLLWYATSDRLISLAFSLGSSVLLLVLYAAYQVFPLRAERKSILFLAALFCAGLLYMVVFTPFTAPDEMYHFWASYSLSNTLMGEGGPNDPMDMREGDAQMLSDLSIRLQASDYDAVYNGFTSPNENYELIKYTTDHVFEYDSNPPQVKLASAVGITIARLFNLSPYVLLYLGRIFNFIFYAALVWLAYRITPIGKGAFAAVSLLPMSLHLAASYSYDAGILGLSFLLTALCFRAIYREDAFGWREGFEIVLTAAILAPCKVVYIFIAVLCCFIPSKRFSSKKKEALIKVGCALLIAFILVLIKLPNVMSTVGVGTGAPLLNYRGEESGHFYTISDLFKNPIKMVIIYVRTLSTLGSYYLSTMVGSSLGWFQPEITAPVAITVSLIFVLAFASTCSDDDQIVLSNGVRIACVVIFIVGLLAVMASMLFGWTFNNEPVVAGVQGRYLLPYLPMFLLGLRSKTLYVKCHSEILVVGIMASINVAYLIRIFGTALTLV